MSNKNQEEELLVVFSKLNKSKNVQADVKKINKMFFGDADVLATTEITIGAPKKYVEKYKDKLQKIADKKGYDMEIIQ